jgi:ethanolamine utilization protein EutP (predicted NTPase)
MTGLGDSEIYQFRARKATFGCWYMLHGDCHHVLKTQAVEFEESGHRKMPDTYLGGAL